MSVMFLHILCAEALIAFVLFNNVYKLTALEDIGVFLQSREQVFLLQ